jgi:hypothetical protein
MLVLIAGILLALASLFYGIVALVAVACILMSGVHAILLRINGNDYTVLLK